MADQPAPLTFDVYVTPSVRTVSDDLPPGAKGRWWSPISATLITGQQDAVLVDALMTVGQARDLGDWVAAHRTTCPQRSSWSAMSWPCRGGNGFCNQRPAPSWGG
jgi:hypothetical protein